MQEELEELLGSDGTTTYISSEEWGVTLHPTSSRLLLTKGSLSIVENTTSNTVACTLVLSSSSPFLLLTQETILILLVAAALLLLLLLAICLYCCCRRRRRGKLAVSSREGSIEDIFLGSRSKSPLYDELSIPFIDASLPPTPKTCRSGNPLEILLGRSLGGSTASLSDPPSSGTS